MPRGLAAFPWHALDRLDRTSVRALRGARGAVRELGLELAGLERAVGELLEASARLIVRRSSAASRRPRGVQLALEVAERRARVTLGLEPALVSRVLAPFVGRTLSVERLDERVDAALLGALSALAIEAARRAGALPLLVPATPFARSSEPQLALLAETTLMLGDHAYAIDALVELFASQNAAPLRDLATLGELPIALRLVAGVSCALPSELALLEVGGAWIPGKGWWIDALGTGRGVLASPCGERGAGVDLARDGQIVLREESVELPVEVELCDGHMADDISTKQVLRQAALEAPLVVRVELGSVTLSAREWAELRPGDVIETGQGVGEPAVLRIAGREVARGELVDIEGELGVRILELTHEGGA